MTPGPMICRTSGETWCKCGCFAEGKPYNGMNGLFEFGDSHTAGSGQGMTLTPEQMADYRANATELAKRMANYPPNRAGRRAFWRDEEKARRKAKR